MTSRSTDRPGRSDAVATRSDVTARSDAATSRSAAVGADKAETQPQNCTCGNRTPAEKLVFAKAALALAGHEVTNPTLRNILEQQAHGNLTGEQARAAIRKHVQG
jgi:hypothetical protein